MKKQLVLRVALMIAPLVLKHVTRIIARYREDRKLRKNPMVTPEEIVVPDRETKA